MFFLFSPNLVNIPEMKPHKNILKNVWNPDRAHKHLKPLNTPMGKLGGHNKGISACERAPLRAPAELCGLEVSQQVERDERTAGSGLLRDSGNKDIQQTTETGAGFLVQVYP